MLLNFWKWKGYWRSNIQGLDMKWTNSNRSYEIWKPLRSSLTQLHDFLNQDLLYVAVNLVEDWFVTKFLTKETNRFSNLIIRSTKNNLSCLFLAKSCTLWCRDPTLEEKMEICELPLDNIFNWMERLRQYYVQKAALSSFT